MDARAFLLDWIESRRDEIVACCAELVRRPSPNPPGDTRAPAALLRELIASHGLGLEVVADQEHTPNLVSSCAGSQAGRHLSLIGHMDTYPAGDEARWSRPPFSGALAEGRIFGRGAGDMKSGLTALTYAYLALAALGSFRGRLMLLAVSDEMNFSPHGARLLEATRPELMGDAALDAEPTSPDFVLFGEKGMLWIEVRYQGESGAGAFAPGLSNAIEGMAELLQAIARLREWQVEMPSAVRAALSASGGSAGLPPEALTYADDRVLPLVTVNVGTIEGGRKINLVADECRAEVDIRLPLGLSLERVLTFLDELFAAHPRASYRVIQASAPNWTDPADPLVRALLANARAIRSHEVRPEIGITASDTRLFRGRGLPAAMIGPRIVGQGAPDESIAAQDLIDCAKIFALAALDYLGPADPRG
jgi:succinyl-diaminopimelate desuccinylase